MIISDVEALQNVACNLADRGAFHLLDDFLRRVEKDMGNDTPQIEFVWDFIDAHCEELEKIGLVNRIL